MIFLVALLLEIAASGRAVSLAQSPSERVAPLLPLAPGQPPLVSFRFFEAKERHGLNGLDLVLDDAGH